MVTTGQVQRSIQRFKDYAEDLLRSDVNTFEGTLDIFLHFCETDPVFSSIHAQLQSVPQADFDEWYGRRMATGGSMPGGADLTFPTDVEVRMSLMYELLRRIRDKRVDFVGFALRFFAISTNKVTAYVQAINEAISRPLVRELGYRLEDLSETLPDDRLAVVPQASFQIIHQAKNVIQQSAVGSHIQQIASHVQNPELVRLFDDLQRALERLNDYHRKQEEYTEIVMSARELATAETPKSRSVKALLSSLPQVAPVISIIASILSVLGT